MKNTTLIITVFAFIIGFSNCDPIPTEGPDCHRSIILYNNRPDTVSVYYLLEASKVQDIECGFGHYLVPGMGKSAIELQFDCWEDVLDHAPPNDVIRLFYGDAVISLPDCDSTKLYESIFAIERYSLEDLSVLDFNIMIE